MSGMGAYTRKRMFTPTGPAQFMGSMARLLGEQNKSLQGVGDAVEGYGQSRAGGKLAELMGEDGFDKLSPEQAQAAAMEATGGRTLNKRGENMLSTMMRNKQNTLDNQNRVDAADTLFGRQNSQIGQRFANAKSLQKSGAKLNQLLNGDKMTPVKFANMKQERDDLMSGIKGQTDSLAKAAMNKRIYELDYALNTFAGKSTSDQKEFLGGAGRGSGLNGNVTNEVKAKIPTEIALGLSSTQLSGLQKGLNSGQIKVMNTSKGKEDSSGRALRSNYQAFDRAGNPVQGADFELFN